MKTYDPTSIPPIPHASKMERMRKRYRQALLSVGKSPDYHIFDLSNEFIGSLKDSQAKRFLFGLKRYFATLSEEDRRIFVNDILESGRHYPFWYLEDYTRRVYEQKLRAIVEEVPSCLG